MVIVVIIGIAGLIFYLFGGFDYVNNLLNSYFNPSKINIQQEAAKFGDFSKISNDYELTRVVDMFGIKAVIAKHKITNQKIAIVKTGWVFNLSQNDIKSDNIDQQLEDIASRFNAIPIKLSNLEVGKKGNLKALGQNIPYVQIKVLTTGTINRNMEGIIGVAVSPDKKNDILVSVNDPGKYNQNITDKFFKSIKLASSENKNQ